MSLDLAQPATVQPALLTAAATLLVGVLAATAAYLASKRDRRRQMYGEAFKAAMSWKEMPFRVRRRSEGQAEDLVAKFHDLQEEINYYSGWIGSESWAMRQSYERFVRQVKSDARGPIRDAWAELARVADGPIPPKLNDVPTDLSLHVEEFLRDVRMHLSPWLLPKIIHWVNERGRSSVGLR